MAHYLILKDALMEGMTPPHGLIVEAKNIQRAIEEIDLPDGDKVTVYRIADGPRKVGVRSETIRRIDIE